VRNHTRSEPANSVVLEPLQPLTTQQKGRSQGTGLSVLGITVVPRYERATSTVMPSDVRLLMGITSFTLIGLASVLTAWKQMPSPLV